MAGGTKFYSIFCNLTNFITLDNFSVSKYPLLYEDAYMTKVTSFIYIAFSVSVYTYRYM